MLATLENPHIPEDERLGREDDDFVHFQDEEKAMEAMTVKLGEVPEWLQQRFKSKYKTKAKKESPEEKAERAKKSKADMLTKKRKANEEATQNLQKMLQEVPSPEAQLLDKRDWDMAIMQGVRRLLSSPRAKKKV